MFDDIRKTIFSAITLTAAYAGNVGEAMGIGRYNRLLLYPTFNPADTTGGTSCDLLIEVSPDGTNWFTFAPTAPTGYAAQADGSLRFTYSGTGAQKGNAIALDVPHSQVRVSAKENGATNFGTLTLESVVTKD